VWGRPAVFRTISRRSLGRRVPALLALTACAALAAGCGGGKRQDAGERARTYEMKVVRAIFPARQFVARPTLLVLQVRNTGLLTVPNVAVTLDSLSYTEHFPELAANKRPVWAIERGPGVIAEPPVETQEVSQLGGAQTAYVNTWALGPLAAGQTQTFRWLLAPVKPGVHTVNYRIAAGLAGKAKVRLIPGSQVAGRFAVNVAAAPPLTHVDPTTGRVVVGAAPKNP
jgi:hypothetical protein